MAYIYLEELKKILPGILDQWIDEDDESWEWIFQEIEQKCHVGKKSKKKKKVSKIEAIEIAIMAHRNDINELNKKVDNIQHDNTQQWLTMKDIQAEVRHLRDDVKAAKSMAETAKQRTEVDYSKYSGKSDGEISYGNPCASCKHKLEESFDHPCIGCCHNGINISGTDKWEAKENDKDCKSCKYYCNEEAIKEHCVSCDAYQCWEAKENE